MRKSYLILLFGVLSAVLTAEPARGQFAYQDTPLLGAIDEIQQKTGFRFLYRESLISDVQLSFESDYQHLFRNLKSQLSVHRLDLKVDSTRKQAIIYTSKTGSSVRNISISGQVIDASTGERLPFATISWKENGRIQGVVTNSAGIFSISKTLSRPSITITASYVGYESHSIELETSSNSVDDLSIRLKPRFIGGNEVVVTGMNFYSSIDSSLNSLIDIGSFSPIGESNTIRALQTLPSVNFSTAISDGINVRGSPRDGFQVLLDGLTIYNQSHLFGLLDSFNSDVLQTSGMFYDITPAEFSAPPGGTLSLHTKTGSLQNYNVSAGVSNTAYTFTLEGPLKKGKSSFLFSGRNSYMDTINWLNNEDLIRWGLNIERPSEPLADNLLDIESSIIRPGDSRVNFYDLHGKLYFEGKSGNRLILSGYYGADNTEQSAERLTKSFGGINNQQLFEFKPVETINEWGNFSASAKYQAGISKNLFSHTTAGASIYETSFSKDDFTYSTLSPDRQSFQTFIFPFENKSILNEIKFDQRFDASFSNFIWTVGTSYQYYLGEYFESSFDRPGFFMRTSAHKADFYSQIDVTGVPLMDLNAGGRVHYYSNGDYLQWSPRFKIKLFPDHPVSVGFGFSKNYQFLHEVSLFNVVSSDVWVLSDDRQPPGSVDYLSAGIYIKFWRHLYLQIEGYIKDYENLRLHEINTQSLSNTFNAVPWFFSNDGRGEGVELLMSNFFSHFTLTQTFTLSSMELQNDLLNDGEPFNADWDRTYRYLAMVEIHPVKNFNIYLSWLYASGAPNKLAIFGPDNEERLDDYYRTDLGFEFKKRTASQQFKIGVSFFNLFNRRNTWYRELSFVVDKSRSVQRLRAVPVNIYDLGFQPSFEIKLNF